MTSTYLAPESLGLSTSSEELSDLEKDREREPLLETNQKHKLNVKNMKTPH